MNMKKHDTGPPVRAHLLSAENGLPVDLEDSSATFIMYLFGDDGSRNEIVKTAAVIETPEADGYIRYDWVDGDTETVGNHKALFEIVYSSGVKESYPSKGYIEIRIEDDLDDA
jgi:hypothetical protein